jgi:hypothetical protein
MSSCGCGRKEIRRRQGGCEDATGATAMETTGAAAGTETVVIERMLLTESAGEAGQRVAEEAPG